MGAAEAAVAAAEERAAQLEAAYRRYVCQLEQGVVASASSVELAARLAAAEQRAGELERRLAQSRERQARAEEAAQVAMDELLKVEAAATERMAKAEQMAQGRIEALTQAVGMTQRCAQSKVEAAVLELSAEATTHKLAASKAKQQAAVQAMAAQREASAMRSALASTDAALMMWKERAVAAEELLEQMQAYLDTSGLAIGPPASGKLAARAEELRQALDESTLKQRAIKLESSRLRKAVGSGKFLRQLIAQGPRAVAPAQQEEIARAASAIKYVQLPLPAPDEVVNIAAYQPSPLADEETSPAEEPLTIVAEVKEVEVEVEAPARVPTPLILPRELISLPEWRRKQRGFRGFSREEVKKRELAVEPGTGSGREVVFQAFHWESAKGSWYRELMGKAADIAEMGFTSVWLPPPTTSVSPEGYMPVDYYNLNSRYGTEEELKYLINELHFYGLTVLGDVVLNHRCASEQSLDGTWNIFKGAKCSWGPEAIVRDDPNYRGRGNPSSGDFFTAAPNIDHSQLVVQRDICEWLMHLRDNLGYDGWRLDFVRGFWGGHTKTYIEASSPVFAIGEYWDALAYHQSEMEYNQDAHRQRIIDWINATGGLASAFDVTTKGILGQALGSGEYYRLKDANNRPPGVLGWWPSRAVTFLENHDTGSTQRHWPFPDHKVAEGYAYILTHPGTPTVFFDHVYFWGLHATIKKLIAIRTRAGIHCRSKVQIIFANQTGYVACINDKLCVRLGPSNWAPNDLLGAQWKYSLGGHPDTFCVWERAD
eukprot:jgi/Mesvir1/24045/Mv10779-RA.1